ncbi:MAG: methenyltetrahydromethanopterin cyclohydrolase [Candidatus Bathyarchaeota archaeon]|jgi:methenyltetrahydromethanopterin cyclohydrolase|nr:methenyltetrahydromethanopterin cyclohydrolase [Candidatus Bathyarchaeota archaeon]
MGKTLSVNRLAWKILEELCDNAEFYGVKIEKTSSGTIIVDAGIKAKGGFQTGKLITEICMGGCGKAQIINKQYGDMELPSIFVYTDNPAIATLGSQYAGWQIKEGEYFAIGSGPARALALKPKEIYEEIGCKDDFERGIIVLETDKPPPEKLLERFAKDCKVSPENLAVVLTPTASIAGATQVSGRIVETGIHKLRKLGLNPNAILYGCGCAPIPPPHPKFTWAMARTNDAILYGGTTYLVIEHDDEGELKKIVEKAPSKASKSYGKPFIEIFKEANYDFYKIDPNLFAPATITINNVKTGNVFKAGEINSQILAKSLGF